MSQEEWLQVVASYHFLVHVSRESEVEARRTLRERMPRLCSFVDQAEKALDVAALG